MPPSGAGAPAPGNAPCRPRLSPTHRKKSGDAGRQTVGPWSGAHDDEFLDPAQRVEQRRPVVGRRGHVLIFDIDELPGLVDSANQRVLQREIAIGRERQGPRGVRRPEIGPGDLHDVVAGGGLGRGVGGHRRRRAGLVAPSMTERVEQVHRGRPLDAGVRVVVRTFNIVVGVVEAVGIDIHAAHVDQHKRSTCCAIISFW